MFKRVLVFVLLTVSCFTAAFGQSQTIPKIGLVDVNRIYTAYSANSQAARQYQQHMEQFNKDYEKMSNDLADLRKRREDAFTQGSQDLVNRLDTEIRKNAEDLVKFHQTRTEALNRERNNLMQSGTFQNDLKEAIDQTGRLGGYSMIMQYNASILWYSAIDITDEVIRRIQTIRDQRR